MSGVKIKAIMNGVIKTLEDFLSKADAPWKDKPHHEEGEMRCEIKWESGKWSVLVGDGCNDGTSDAYASLDKEQINQAMVKYIVELEDWIKDRPKYGHSVEKEKAVLKICQDFLKRRQLT